MDDERRRRRVGWLFAIGYPLGTLVVNLALGRPADRVLGSTAGAVLVAAGFVFVSRHPQLLRRMEDNRYRLFAWMFGGATLLFLLSALLLREPVVLVVMLVPLTALVVALIAGRRASGG